MRGPFKLREGVLSDSGLLFGGVPQSISGLLECECEIADCTGCEGGYQRTVEIKFIKGSHSKGEEYVVLFNSLRYRMGYILVLPWGIQVMPTTKTTPHGRRVELLEEFSSASLNGRSKNVPFSRGLPNPHASVEWIAHASNNAVYL
jgi:hypothetical protein